MPSSDFSPNNVWATSPVDGLPEELILPSGQTALCRRMTVQAVIESGMMAETDQLTATVDQYTRKVKGGKGVPDGTPVISDDILRDPAALTKLITMVDLVMPVVVVSPVVHLHYTTTTVGKTKVTKMIPVEDRIEGAAYTDQISLDDKMFLFDWALGGIQAFSSFRGEADGNVGNLAPRPGHGGKAKRRNRNN